jgi:hypothetical protein
VKVNASPWSLWLRALTADRRLQTLPLILGWIAVGGLIVAAAVVRLQIPPVALAEHDSWGWLSPALNWIGGLGFYENFEREWLYGAFIAFCLRVTGSFVGYILIQQVLGLAAAVFMWLTWRRWLSLFPQNFWWELICTPVGLFLIALFLFNPTVLVLELAIRPEAIMAFVTFLQLYCVVSYCKFRWHRFHLTRCILFGAFCLPLAWAMFVLKPNWALAVPATIFPVLLGTFFGAAPRLARWLPLLAGLALIGLTLWLPGKLLFHRSAETRVVLPMTLFTIHADIIRDSMTSEINDPTLAPDRREFLAKFLPELSRELQVAVDTNKYYRTLGFDPDYLMYRSSIFPKLENYWKMSPKDLAAFCRQNFLSAILHHPSAYARKVITQLKIFLFPDDRTFFRKRISLDGLCLHAASTIPAVANPAYNPKTQSLVQIYLDRVRQEGTVPRDIKVVPRFRKFLKAAGPLSPVIGFAFLFSLAASLTWTPLAALRLPGLVALLIFSAPAGNALTVAMVHSLDNSRYRGSYGPLLLFALGAMVCFVVATAVTAAISLWKNRLRNANPRTSE